MPPEVLVEDNPVYDTPMDVFSFGGIALHVFLEEWPTPGGQKMKDTVTKKLMALSEAEWHQRYLDKMTGKAAGLRKMVEQCLDDDPIERPTIQEVSNTVEAFKVNITVWTIYTVGSRLPERSISFDVIFIFQSPIWAI